MPSEGYTTVTIRDETAAKLSEVIAVHDLESMATAIEYAALRSLDEEAMSNVDLAKLLYRRLQPDEEQQIA